MQKTKGGLQITTFVKESRGSSDFYAVALAPYYNADLYCATWLRGGSESRCLLVRRCLLGLSPLLEGQWGICDCNACGPSFSLFTALRVALAGNGVVRPSVCKPPGFPYNVWNLNSFKWVILRC